MKLILTEKQAQGKNISDALNLNNVVEMVCIGKDKEKQDINVKVKTYSGDYNGDKIIIVPSKGHIIELRGRSSQIVFFDFNWKEPTKRSKDKYAKFMLMKKYIDDAEEVIIATDADDEGELIGYNISRYFDALDKTTRMIFLSMVEKELVKSYKERGNIRLNIASSAELRARMDKMFGYVFSKYLTRSYCEITNSEYIQLGVGRVMTPVLYRVIANMEEIEKAEKELKEKDPEVHYSFTLKLLSPTIKKYDMDAYEVQSLENLEDIETYNITLDEAVKLREKFKEVFGVVMGLSEKDFVITPPNSGLTIDQVRQWAYDKGIEYKRTSGILEALYLNKLITYPRSESTILPEEVQYHEEILVNMLNYYNLDEHREELVEKDLPRMGEDYDGAHYAIHPTGVIPKGSLPEDYRLIYDYVCKTYIKGFCFSKKITRYFCELDFIDNEEGDYIDGLHEEIIYWQTVNFFGYQIVDNPSLINYEKPSDDIIPKIEIDQQFGTYPVIEEYIDLHLPRRITKKEMFRYMRNKNLGTDATRDIILDKLWEQNFVRGNKEVFATVLGLNIIKAIRQINPKLITADLTREFDKKKNKVKKDLTKYEPMLEEVKDEITDLIESKLDDMEEIGTNIAFFGECPKCSKRMKLVSFRTNFFLACESDTCDFTSPI